MNLKRSIHRLPNEKEFIEHIYDFGAIGYIRFELYDTVLFVHPVPKMVTKSSISYLRDKMFEVGVPLMDRFKYDQIFFCTINTKLVRIFSKNLYQHGGDYKGTSIYYVDREDI